MKKSNIIIIGASGRNVGKTEFACQLIEQKAENRPVFGIKITTIKEKDGKCPRGGEGCGVCSSLKGDYMITEETEGPVEKDTVRMLNAGAERVYWLRVLREYLKEGVNELLQNIPDDACIVCESNSARRVIEPGIFIIIREKDSTEIKHSCKAVAEFADKIIDFDGTDWTLQPENIVFTNNRWKII